jgi:hypothetical protein
MPSPAEIEYYIAFLLDICAGCYKSLRGHTKIVNTDTIDGIIVCEQRANCGHCGVKVDYYAYGHWEAEHYGKQFEKDHPKAAELLKRLTGVQ